MSTVSPARGEVWMVDFDPTKGHEQGGRRPALVVSVDVFNSGPAELVIVLPITKSNHRRLVHFLTGSRVSPRSA
jgi:mRNA interferase MazF